MAKFYYDVFRKGTTMMILLSRRIVNTSINDMIQFYHIANNKAYKRAISDEFSYIVSNLNNKNLEK